MVALADAIREQIWAEYMRARSRERESIPLTKADLRAIVNATDDWIDANAASFNSSLPLPGRTALTARQKTLIFMMVAAERVNL